MFVVSNWPGKVICLQILFVWIDRHRRVSVAWPNVIGMSGFVIPEFAKLAGFWFHTAASDWNVFGFGTINPLDGLVVFVNNSEG